MMTGPNPSSTKNADKTTSERRDTVKGSTKTDVAKKETSSQGATAGTKDKDKDKDKTVAEAAANNMTRAGSSVNLNNINITTYTCDFGNIIVGKSVQKSFRLTNCGKIAINFNFDKKLLNQAGIIIEPDKAMKVMPNQSVLFKVVMQTRKNSRFGRTRFFVPVDIKNGPQYTIDFTANLTIPELHMSKEDLDFEKVVVNTRKTVKIRLENKKDVTCEWFFHSKSENTMGMTSSSSTSGGRQKEEIEKFQVWPHSGTLQPGQRQSVDVMFTPSGDKPYTQKLAFKCN